ncbi:MAG: hypothetical protein AAB539_03985 [Patescibacteria group bacterium]
MLYAAKKRVKTAFHHKKFPGGDWTEGFLFRSFLVRHSFTVPSEAINEGRGAKAETKDAATNFSYFNDEGNRPNNKAGAFHLLALRASSRYGYSSSPIFCRM